MRVTRPLAGKGMRAYGGVDFSSHLDLTALSIAIPHQKKIHLDLYCWIPEAAFEKKETRNKDQFRQWRREGWLTVHQGEEIDYDLMLDDFKEIKTQYKITELASDPWGLAMPAQTLKKSGFKIYKFRQGEQTMSPAIKDFQALVYGKRLKHYGNPILAWAMNNVRMTQTRSGGFTPDKSKSTDKIDPVIASVMACALAEQAQRGIGKSIYSQRGMIIARKKLDEPD
jgi:phage terminase large subunit-like protein